MHEPTRLLITPVKFLLEPVGPVAVADHLFAERQAAADLDHVLDRLLAQRADGVGVFV